MMASVRTLGSRPYIVRELAYTIILSAIALGSMGWMSTPDRTDVGHPQISSIVSP
jgi:hypothetical protein